MTIEQNVIDRERVATDRPVGAIENAAETEKLDGIRVRNWWYMLLYAWRDVDFEGRFRTNAEIAPDLRELLTRLLVLFTRRQIRRGLRGDYVERSEEMTGVRGRIDFQKTIRDLTMYRGRLMCDYEEFTLNVPRNQIIRSTFNSSLSRGFTDVEKRDDRKVERLVAEVQVLVRMMHEIDRTRITRRLIATELRNLGRNEVEYKLMLKICMMLLDPATPVEDTDSLLEIVDWARGNEPRLFERFVANFYKLHLDRSVWRVQYHKQLEWQIDETKTVGDLRVPGMETDVFLTHLPSGRVFVLDTKFYQSPFDQRNGTRSVKSEHIYQLYAYIASQDRVGMEHEPYNGVLLYGQPVDGHAKFQTEIQNHGIFVRTLNLDQKWSQVEADLLELIKDVSGDE